MWIERSRSGRSKSQHANLSLDHLEFPCPTPPFIRCSTRSIRRDLLDGARRPIRTPLPRHPYRVTGVTLPPSRASRDIPAVARTEPPPPAAIHRQPPTAQCVALSAHLRCSNTLFSIATRPDSQFGGETYTPECAVSAMRTTPAPTGFSPWGWSCARARVGRRAGGCREWFFSVLTGWTGAQGLPCRCGCNSAECGQESPPPAVLAISNLPVS
jgi:hypothetical protein